MPKVKTNSAAHILTKKSKKRKRNLGKMSIVEKANLPIVKKLLVK